MVFKTIFSIKILWKWGDHHLVSYEAKEEAVVVHWGLWVDLSVVHCEEINTLTGITITTTVPYHVQQSWIHLPKKKVSFSTINNTCFIRLYEYLEPTRKIIFEILFIVCKIYFAKKNRRISSAASVAQLHSRSFFNFEIIFMVCKTVIPRGVIINFIFCHHT